MSFHECTFERATFRGLPSSTHTAYPFTASGGRFALLGFPPDAIPVSSSTTTPPLREEPLRTTSLKRSRDRYATEDRSANPTRPYTLASARITGRR